MREINLMARRAHRERRSASPLRTWLGLGGAVVAVWVAAGVVRVGRIGREVAETQAAVERIAAEGEVLVTLANEYEALQKEASHARPFQRPMPPVAALALVSRLVPERVELEALELKMPKACGRLDGKAASAGETGEKSQLQLRGIAGNDGATISLLKNLTASPFLTRVRAEEQHAPALAQDGHGRFSIVMEMGRPRSPAKEGGRP